MTRHQRHIQRQQPADARLALRQTFLYSILEGAAQGDDETEQGDDVEPPRTSGVRPGLIQAVL